ncbi:MULTISPECIES: bifunctional 1-(5-phosphoribosyl)-5-((5-phosphoribosylamino)methylideneamino)imidazole-4-carboxamide isomerase/phosphoribosylanthranilate isomerase PriA [Corynebacterium]|uniref:bifunctional 1-(5-phosphoribosyl)-5-((5- phosphoribosylamino)methylideneamino)imidazole-4- carboxamide isomerase/phosphoribosylanthranilate isomerase PriA n=1 Tax=Corynebacterium TaxID=1716 RepID=UPI000C0767E7|nr:MULTISPECIES: bifunctional 1-(5-phosphoribosyl)-5-((5-phosphoribosylamino)methylideneamino)imidazole-4-carboxamide isomerase/phosphoribosylanthranilate isomerase PriA [Corynebacterium]MBF0580662.1 bifunctional 1-(5-phosphoribosyl)-5-((5-phosphoribosylamino)methylideneamino)imidazole-4-carboxamide isomerase/phosphoribosylanthranilate isomerase PriA [Corynebacterium sp. ED61]
MTSAAQPLVLLPAVDVADGQAVRLVQGEAGTETNYGAPIDAALAWQNAGAEWVHLVDLDAAFGRGSNFKILRDVVGQLDVDVELSGGIRDDESLERALSTGCRRVNIGTAALEDPEWCESVIKRYGDKVAIGLDTRQVDGEWRLRGRGWTSDGGELWEVLERLDSQGVSRLVVTDVSRDGMLNGPNIELLREVAAATSAPVVASGGISSLDDIRALAKVVGEGVDSAIVGKALYAGKFTLEEALEAARP